MIDLNIISPYLFDKYRRMKRFFGFTDERYKFFDTLSRENQGKVNFIQIGSNDGIINDPIREFIIRDRWSGIFIEPEPFSFRRLKKNYSHLDQSRFVFLNVAISKNSSKSFPFWTLDEKSAAILPDKVAFSLLRKSSIISSNYLIEYCESQNIPAEYIKKIKIEALSFNDLVKHYVSNKNIDVLVIDAEGYDSEILSSIDFNSVNISSIFFELNFSKEIQNNLFQLLNENNFSIKKEGNIAFASRHKSKEIKPFAAQEYHDYFENKSYRFFSGVLNNWNYDIKKLLSYSKKWANGPKLLDIGCGAGTLLVCFERFGYKCYGVDFDQTQIETAKKLAKKVKADIVFEKAMMEDIPFSNGFFDITTSKDVVEHLPNSILEIYLEQSNRLLKEEGLLIISTKPTKYTYLFKKPYVFLLLPFSFMNDRNLQKFLSFLDNSIPKLYKKITGLNMPNTWQHKPPGHCNCPDLKVLSKKVEDANFEIIFSKAFIRPNQKYFRYCIVSFVRKRSNQILLLLPKKQIRSNFFGITIFFI